MACFATIRPRIKSKMGDRIHFEGSVSCQPQTLTVWGTSVSTNVDEFTVPEKILVAADQLDKQGQSPFSAEALIVAAWQKFPKTFGLKGFAEQYPDSNKVLSSIMGVRGLAGRGWLAKMGQKLYVLSRDGRQLVRRLLSDGSSPPVDDAIKV